METAEPRPSWFNTTVTPAVASEKSAVSLSKPPTKVSLPCPPCNQSRPKPPSRRLARVEPISQSSPEPVLTHSMVLRLSTPVSANTSILLALLMAVCEATPL